MKLSVIYRKKYEIFPKTGFNRKLEIFIDIFDKNLQGILAIEFYENFKNVYKNKHTKKVGGNSPETFIQSNINKCNRVKNLLIRGEQLLK